jgi:hypothetical protein
MDFSGDVVSGFEKCGAAAGRVTASPVAKTSMS